MAPSVEDEQIIFTFYKLKLDILLLCTSPGVFGSLFHTAAFRINVYNHMRLISALAGHARDEHRMRYCWTTDHLRHNGPITVFLLFFFLGTVSVCRLTRLG